MLCSSKPIVRDWLRCWHFPEDVCGGGGGLTSSTLLELSKELPLITLLNRDWPVPLQCIYHVFPCTANLETDESFSLQSHWTGNANTSGPLELILYFLKPDSLNCWGVIPHACSSWGFDTLFLGSTCLKWSHISCALCLVCHPWPSQIIIFLEETQDSK